VVTLNELITGLQEHEPKTTDAKRKKKEEIGMQRFSSKYILVKIFKVNIENKEKGPYDQDRKIFWYRQ
jgi:hypothetical protein